MPAPELLSQMRDLANEAAVRAEEYSGSAAPIKAYIIDHFGENGLVAAYIVIAVLILFIVSRIAKLTFSTIKYLVIPAVALAFLASYFSPFSFAAALPVSVTACSLFLLFKG